MTEKDLAREITRFFLENAEGNSFTPIVAFGKNSAIPHYTSSEDVKIKNDGILLIDLGCLYKGYCGDLTRTFYIGTAPYQFRRIYSRVKEAQENCIKSLKTGRTGAEADKTVRNTFKTDGYEKYFIHGTGHGVGLAVHEAPKLRKNSTDILQDGMVFSIEPGIYIENFGGVRIEDIVYLKNSKPVNITNR